MNELLNTDKQWDRDMLNPEKARRDLEAIEREIEQLSSEAAPSGNSDAQIQQLREQIRDLHADLAASPTAWSRVQIARHPQRPHTLDYAKHLFQDFTEIHGDRAFGDDPALVAGLALFHGQPVVAIGHQKG